MSTQESVFAFAERFTDALNAGDPEVVRGFYVPGATIWHNFDNAEQGLDDNLKMLVWFSRKAPGRRYRILRREIVPGGWFQQHVLEATLPNGKQMTLYACCVITMKDGLVARIEEYVDPAQTAVLREARSA